MKEIVQQLKKLFEDWADEEVLDIIPLIQSGSYRSYYRITGKEKTAIGVFNPDKKENRAFIPFTKHFLKKGLNVPKLYNTYLKENIYLLEDLGDTTLFSLIENKKSPAKSSNEIIEYYKQALQHLIRFQIDGGKGLDYSICYPRKKFDRQSILWDLNYFKYYFLKLAKVPFDEQKLEDDFKTFSDILLSADSKYFMYRDFQSRNILIKNAEPYFVDYQGGRKGPLQYDVASILFQAKVNLPQELRDQLLTYYLNELSKRVKVNRIEFKKYFYPFVLIRILQTLGAYGFRGYYEKKSHFLLSIPYALKNLQWLSDKNLIPQNLTELKKVAALILSNGKLFTLQSPISEQKLKVTINSFSYREGIPNDFTGNGGGFVFDCRSLKNPGRNIEFKDRTGLDEDVINYLNENGNVKEFLNSIYTLVESSINNYIQRDFKNLMVNFGCTGGQHRSVYCAEELAKHIKNKFSAGGGSTYGGDVLVEVNHTQLNQNRIL